MKKFILSVAVVGMAVGAAVAGPGGKGSGGNSHPGSPSGGSHMTPSSHMPSGQLCSGGNPNYAGFDQVGDWPLTHLTAGANFDFSYNAWAAHPGWFYTYVTKDGWDPTKPLTWDELEDQPFLVADHPPSTGPTGSVDGYYYWSGTSNCYYPISYVQYAPPTQVQVQVSAPVTVAAPAPAPAPIPAPVVQTQTQTQTQTQGAGGPPPGVPPLPQ